MTFCKRRINGIYYKWVKRKQKVTQTEKLIRTMFDRATLSLGTIRVISKVALIAGSSQQGNALRASVAWCVCVCVSGRGGCKHRHYLGPGL